VLSSDSNDANNSGRIFMMRTGGEGWDDQILHFKA
jgi:hypothetical protein